MKKLIPFFFIAILVSCSSVRTAYDYDRSVDFTKYKTYAFSQESLSLAIGDLNRDRVLNAVETEMAAKGLTKAETADLIVDLHVKAQQQVTATANTTGYGHPYRYGYGGGFSTTQVSYDTYVDGTLIVNLVDAGTEKIVWQGTASKTVDETASPEKREANINYAIKQIFVNYPPKVAAK